MILGLTVIAVLALAVFAVSAHAQFDDPTQYKRGVAVTVFVNDNNDLKNWAWEGHRWSDPGATCTYDGTSWTVHASPPLNTTTVGSQTLTYTCTANDGKTKDGYRIVQVHEDKPPVITLTHTRYTVHNQKASSSYLGASCTDDVEGIMGLGFSVTEKVLSTTESDTERRTTIEYTFTCVDSARQATTAKGTVTEVFKVDKPPIISLARAESTVYNGNADPSYLGASCTDAIDGDIAVSVTESSRTETGSGDDRTVVVQYTFTCTDSDMNTVTATGTVTEDWGPNLGRA